MSLLGAMLLNPAAIDAAIEVGVKPEAFFKVQHAPIFTAVVELHAAGIASDPVSVAARLMERQELEQVGGPGVLLELQATAPSTSNAGRYAAIILDTWRLRVGIGAAGDAIDRLYHFDEAGALAYLQRAVGVGDDQPSGQHSWQPIDLAAVLAGDTLRQPPTMLQRGDGQHLLYPGKVHAFYAESEAGKTMIALHACMERIVFGDHVGYLDFEDSPEGVVERLLGMGLKDDEIVERFHYVRPDDPLDLAATAHLARLLEQHTPALVVIDGITEVMTLNDWDLLDNGDIARFYALLPRRIALSGSAVLMIDHVPKKKEGRGKGGLGGQHKRAGIDGASYILEVIKPFGRGLNGQVKMVVDKDRGGYVRPASAGGEHAADIHILSSDGKLEVRLDTPNMAAAVEEWHGPTRCMDALREFFSQHPDEQFTKSSIGDRLRVIGVSYRNEVIRVALEQLAADGELLVGAGPRNSRIFKYKTKENDALDF